MKPALLVIAGPNGSGKTTVTVRLRADRWSEGVRAPHLVDEVLADVPVSQWLLTPFTG